MLPRKPDIAIHLTLRPLTPNDLPHIVEWTNQPEVRQALGANFPSTPAQAEAHYVPAIMDPQGAGACQYAIELSERLAGLVGYDMMDPVRRACRVHIIVGEPRLWGRGIGTDALSRIVSLLFEAGAVRRIAAEVLVDNERAHRLFRRLGFQREGLRREAELRAGECVDLVDYGLLEAEWRWRAQGASWVQGPPKKDDGPWLREMGWAAGCDPDETEYFIASDETLVWRCLGRPAGCVMLSWREREVSLDILGVDAAFRRRGLASLMLCAVREMALERGIHRMRLVTSNDNAPALTLYQKLGLRIVAVHVGRTERRRGYVRPGLNGIPVRDDIEMVWDL